MALFLSVPVCGEVDHPLGRSEGPEADFFGYLDFVAAVFQDRGKITQVVHGHPGAMGTTFARGTFTRRRSFHEYLVGCGLLHLVKDSNVGGDDETLIGQCLCRVDQLRG